VFEDDDGGILAHYLPWNHDAGYYIVLNRSSPFRLMFTAALSGCAVGVVWGPDGSARVSHHNISGAGGTDDAAQRKRRRGGGQWGFFVQVMRMYRNSSGAETRFVIAEVGELRP
jgi:hypothetical protein